MPRRRPSEVLAGGCGAHRTVVHHVPGLGRRPMGAVIALEHTHMWPGAVAEALGACRPAVLTGAIARGSLAFPVCDGVPRARGSAATAPIGGPERWPTPWWPGRRRS